MSADLIAQYKHRVAVMEAARQGRSIQVLTRGFTSWEPCQEPLWMWGTNDYRVTPEVSYCQHSDGTFTLVFSPDNPPANKADALRMARVLLEGV